MRSTKRAATKVQEELNYGERRLGWGRQTEAMPPSILVRRETD